MKKTKIRLKWLRVSMIFDHLSIFFVFVNFKLFALYGFCLFLRLYFYLHKLLRKIFCLLLLQFHRFFLFLYVLLPIFVQQYINLLPVAMALHQIKSILVFKCFELRIGSVTEQKTYDFLVYHFLSFVHFHFRRTKIMQQWESPCLLNDPVGICSIFYEKLCNHETDFFVLETVIFLNKTIKDGSEGVVVERIGFVNLSGSHDEVVNNFVVAVHAGDDESGLFVDVGLLIDVDVFIFEEESADFF